MRTVHRHLGASIGPAPSAVALRPSGGLETPRGGFPSAFASQCRPFAGWETLP
jgi:hypothetical protein